jgi:hypothetical protein
MKLDENFFITDPHSAVAGVAIRMDTDRFRNADHDFFEHEDQFRDAEPLTIQIYDRINHHLTGTMIGDVPAPFCLDNLDA